jgi:serine transporter
MLSGVLMFAMIAVMLAGEKAMLRAFAVMVYPLAAILLALLLPHSPVAVAGSDRL